MEELLQQLVESEILAEDTKKELTEAINEQIEEAKNAAIVEAKAEVEAQVRVEIQEQYQADKEALIEALDTKVEEYLKEELDELRDDIERFRDLEVEYAEKLAEAKEEQKEVIKGDIEELVETIDSFLDMRLEEEVNELKEYIQNVQRLKFGAEIYEAFEAMFSKKFIDENGLEKDLQENKERLEELTSQLEETTSQLNAAQREKKLDEVLSTLMGSKRDVMENLLRNVETDKLEEAYEHYIPKVLHEEAVSDAETIEESEKETDEEVLAEGDTANTDSDKEEEIAEGTVIATGDSEKMIEESSEDDDNLTDEYKQAIARMQKLGGFNS